jgi:hypothetical protein
MCMHTNTPYQSYSNRVAFIHVIYMSHHEPFRYSLWTHNGRCASCTAHSNSSQLLLINTVMYFNNFRAFMDIWTQHSYLLSIYKCDKLDCLIDAPVKVYFSYHTCSKPLIVWSQASTHKNISWIYVIFIWSPQRRKIGVLLYT